MRKQRKMTFEKYSKEIERLSKLKLPIADILVMMLEKASEIALVCKKKNKKKGACL